MIKRTSQLGLIIALSIAPALLACGREKAEKTDNAAPTTMPEPATIRVTTVDVGNAVGPDKRITGSEHEKFKPSDVIYASVATDGTAPNTNLTARWTYQDGQTVEEQTQNISPSGPATTEFHVSKPSGWPEGKYKVEILVNGASAQTKEFEVKK